MSGMNENPNPESSGGVEHLTASDALMKAMDSASSAENSGSTGDTGTVRPDTATTRQPEAQSNSTNQPPAAGQPNQPKPGEAPEARIQAAVRNARAEARAEVEREFAAFKGLDINAVQEAMALVQELRADPRAFYASLSQHLGIAAPNTAATAAAAEGFKMPEPDLVSADGKLKTFSADLFAKTIQEFGSHLTQQLMERMRPVQEFVKTEQDTRQESERLGQMRAAISQQVESLKQMPHFNEAEVLAVLRTMDPAVRRELGPVAALHSAYNTYLKEKVFPTLSTETEQRVREDFKRKANASNGNVQPNGNTAGATRPRLDSTDALARHMEQLAATVAG